MLKHLGRFGLILWLAIVCQDQGAKKIERIS